ncbi:MAG: hypothetical protein DRP47_04300 [Candidatus Zixiibacteriota bacterium]|nr:MAG: hypothetical protein DRP47_04300 [candidate division Zixibacteria bacterium]
MWALRAFFVTIIVLAIVTFAIYNVQLDQRIDVNLIWTTYSQVTAIEIVFWSFACGVVLSLLVFISAYIRNSVNLRAMRKQIKALESEVTVLRNRPIEESAELLLEDQALSQKNKTQREDQ